MRASMAKSQYTCHTEAAASTHTAGMPHMAQHQNYMQGMTTRKALASARHTPLPVWMNSVGMATPSDACTISASPRIEQVPCAPWQLKHAGNERTPPLGLHAIDVRHLRLGSHAIERLSALISKVAYDYGNTLLRVLPAMYSDHRYNAAAAAAAVIHASITMQLADCIGGGLLDQSKIKAWLQLGQLCGEVFRRVNGLGLS